MCQAYVVKAGWNLFATHKVKFYELCSFSWNCDIFFFPLSNLNHQVDYFRHLRCVLGMFCFHNQPISDMDYRIFIMHTDVNACNCTRACMDTERESALKADWEENLLLHWEIEPASVAWWFDALPTEPHPHLCVLCVSTCRFFSDKGRRSVHFSAFATNIKYVWHWTDLLLKVPVISPR